MRGDGELAAPIYLGLLGRLQAMKASGSLSAAVEAESWHEAVLRHHPTTESTGFPCAECGEPWPCKVFLDIARSL